MILCRSADFRERERREAQVAGQHHHHRGKRRHPRTTWGGSHSNSNAGSSETRRNDPPRLSRHLRAPGTLSRPSHSPKIEAVKASKPGVNTERIETAWQRAYNTRQRSRDHDRSINTESDTAPFHIAMMAFMMLAVAGTSNDDNWPMREP